MLRHRAHGYLASVWPDGYFAIGVDPSSSEEIALLADGAAPEAIQGAGHANTIALECERGPPALLRLTVNGRRVGEARHNEGLGTFQLASLIVTAGPEATTGRFDDFVASSFDP